LSGRSCGWLRDSDWLIGVLTPLFFWWRVVALRGSHKYELLDDVFLRLTLVAHASVL
jgi:hypothetical protein